MYNESVREREMDLVCHEGRIKPITAFQWVLRIQYKHCCIENVLQDLLWTMTPQWDHFRGADTPDLPRPWQIHNHCLPLTNKKGISGEKTSQWELYKCMRDKFGPAEFSYMPESLIIPS